jgi:hypothetical protein
MRPPPSKKLPFDVEPEQVWRAPDGQHYRVFAVTGETAELQRATPGGRVLNARYRVHHEIAKMQGDWVLVSRQ